MRFSSVRFLVLCCGCLFGAATRSAAQTPPAAAPPPPPVWSAEVINDFTDPGGGLPNMNTTSVQFARREGSQSRVFFGVAQHDRYDDLDTSLQAGIGHAFGSRQQLELEASVAFGFGDPVGFAKRDYDVNGSVRVTPRVRAVFEFERSEYVDPLDLNQLTLGLKLTPNDRDWVQPVYVGTQGTVSPGVDAAGHAFGLQASAQMRPALALVFKGGYGHEQALARIRTRVEVVRRLKQLDLSPGLAWTIDQRHTLTVGYSFEDKKGSHTQHGLIVDLLLGF